MRQRLFTVEEANALIPSLELIVGRLQRHRLTLRQHLEQTARECGQAVEDVSVDELLRRRPEVRELLHEIDGLLADIEAVGGELKGLELGLVDFPSLRNGETVLLCWQYGEKEIGYYHSLEAGFSGRKPLRPGTPPRHYLQ